jgi:hypothetical protein
VDLLTQRQVGVGRWRPARETGRATVALYPGANHGAPLKGGREPPAWGRPVARPLPPRRRAPQPPRERLSPLRGPARFCVPAPTLLCDLSESNNRLLAGDGELLKVGISESNNRLLAGDGELLKVGIALPFDTEASR